MLFKIIDISSDTPFKNNKISDFIIVDSGDKTKYGKKIQLNQNSYVEVDNIGSVKSNPTIEIELITKMVIYTVPDFGVENKTNDSSFLDIYNVSDNNFLSLIKKESKLEDYSKMSIQDFNQTYLKFPAHIKVDLITEKEYRNYYKK